MGKYIELLDHRGLVKSQGKEYIIHIKDEKSTIQNSYWLPCSKENKSYMSSYFTYTPNPFGNCQIACFGYFQYFINSIPEEDKKVFFEFLHAILLSGGSWKNSMIVDVHQHIAPKIKEYFDGFILSEMPYVSTNGSHMIIYRIDTRRELFEKYGIITGHNYKILTNV